MVGVYSRNWLQVQYVASTSWYVIEVVLFKFSAIFSQKKNMLIFYVFPVVHMIVLIFYLFLFRLIILK